MDIKININVEPLVPQVLEDGLILVLFKNVVRAAGKDALTEPIRINNITELQENFVLPTVPDPAPEPGSPEEIAFNKLSSTAFNELYSAEYLLRTGANILCYIVTDTITAAEITAIEDIENLNYRIIVIPGENIIDTANANLDKLYEFVNNSDVELYVNFAKDVTSADAETFIEAKAAKLSKNVQLFKNFGLPRFLSKYAVPSTFANGINDFDFVNGFLGIPTAVAVAARKSKLLNLRQSWLPVAGEQYGRVNEFYKLAEKFTKVEKKDLQALNINVLISKIGVGNIIVSQNTMLQLEEENPKHPFYRGHVVTSALMIKRELHRIANFAMYRPNTSGTWELVRLKIKALFAKLVSKDAVEQFSILVGLGETMTEENIADGILKVHIRYLPVRVIEAIEFNVVIQQLSGAIDIEFVGFDNLLDTEGAE